MPTSTTLVYSVPIQVSVRDDSPYNKEDIDITIESREPEVMVLTLENYTSQTFRVDIQTALVAVGRLTLRCNKKEYLFCRKYCNFHIDFLGIKGLRCKNKY